VYPEYGEMRNEVPLEGRWISAEDIAERRRVAFLGALLCKKLFSGTPAVGEAVRINGVRFTWSAPWTPNFRIATILPAMTSRSSFRTRPPATCGMRATPA